MAKCSDHLGVSAIVLNLLIFEFVVLFPSTGSHPGVNKLIKHKHTSSSNSSSQMSKDNELRAELCPGLSEAVANQYRYDKITKKCYRGGSKGPCGSNMIFYGEDQNSIYGVCDCDTINHERALIFHPQSAQCYFVFSQGYCKFKEWLIFNENDLPACAPNPCSVQSRRRMTRSDREYVPFRGKCMELGSQVAECETDEVISFIRGQLFPVCAVESRQGVTSLSLAVPRFRCSPGSAQSILGKCKPKVKFNLS